MGAVMSEMVQILAKKSVVEMFLKKRLKKEKCELKILQLNKEMCLPMKYMK